MIATDAHKVFGVWGLLFHTTIALTGAFLGFAAVVLVPVAAFVSCGGDQEALVAAVLPDVEPVLSGIPEEIRIAGVLETVRSSNKGQIVSASSRSSWSLSIQCKIMKKLWLWTGQGGEFESDFCAPHSVGNLDQMRFKRETRGV